LFTLLYSPGGINSTFLLYHISQKKEMTLYINMIRHSHAVL